MGKYQGGKDTAACLKFAKDYLMIQEDQSSVDRWHENSLALMRNVLFRGEKTHMHRLYPCKSTHTNSEVWQNK